MRHQHIVYSAPFHKLTTQLTHKKTLTSTGLIQCIRRPRHEPFHSPWAAEEFSSHWSLASPPFVQALPPSLSAHQHSRSHNTLRTSPCIHITPQIIKPNQYSSQATSCSQQALSASHSTNSRKHHFPHCTPSNVPVLHTAHSLTTPTSSVHQQSVVLFYLFILQFPGV